MAVAGVAPLAAGVAMLLVWGKLVSIALVAALLPGWMLYARVEGRYAFYTHEVRIDVSINSLTAYSNHVAFDT